MNNKEERMRNIRKQMNQSEDYSEIVEGSYTITFTFNHHKLSVVCDIIDAYEGNVEYYYGTPEGSSVSLDYDRMFADTATMFYYLYC